jgi:succinate dehydrogenase/fumarate reductase-like Fe-S protein
MDMEGFGSCSATGACEVVCPQGIIPSRITNAYSISLMIGQHSIPPKFGRKKSPFDA